MDIKLIKFEQVIASLFEIIPNMEIMIVGSYALYLHGLEVEPHDLDLEIRLDNKEDIKYFKLLIEAYGNSYYKFNNYGKFKPYIFKFKDVLINVWIVDEFNHDSIKLGDKIHLSGLMSTLKVKASYKRPKDYEFLSKLASSILNLIRYENK